MSERAIPRSDDLALLTVDELAALLHVDRRTIINWRSAGLGPRGFRAGRAVLYRRTEVERWLSEREAAAQGGGAA